MATSAYMPNMPFHQVSHEGRSLLLKGPTILVVLNYENKQSELIHQFSCAKGVASSERCKQLKEQTFDIVYPRYSIEIPQAALAAASTAFRDFLDGASCSTPFPVVELDFNLLPGYAVEVIDWYIKSLRAPAWSDFPIKPEATGMDYDDDRQDWWYYYYAYVAMQRLHLDDTITEPLRDFLYDKIQRCGFTDDYASLCHFVKHLAPEDPVYECLCQRHAGHLFMDEWLISRELYQKVVEFYPAFGGAVEEMVRELREDCVAEEAACDAEDEMEEREPEMTDEDTMSDTETVADELMHKGFQQPQRSWAQHRQTASELIESIKKEIEEQQDQLDEKDEKIDMLSRIHNFSPMRKQSASLSPIQAHQLKTDVVSAHEEMLHVEIPAPVEPSTTSAGTTTTSALIEAFDTKLQDEGRQVPSGRTQSARLPPSAG